MQFATNKSRTIEIRNEGNFEFIYEIRKADVETSDIFKRILHEMLTRDESKPIIINVDPKDKKKQEQPKKDDKKKDKGGEFNFGDTKLKTS